MVLNYKSLTYDKILDKKTPEIQRWNCTKLQPDMLNENQETYQGKEEKK